MPFIPFTNLSNILVDLPIENVKPTILLHLMRSVDVLLNGLLILIYLILYLLLLLHILLLPGKNLSLDSSSGTLGLRIDQLNIRILSNRSHILNIILLQLILEVEKSLILITPAEHPLQLAQSNINILDNILSLLGIHQQQHLTLVKTKCRVKLFLNKHLQHLQIRCRQQISLKLNV